MGHTQTYSATGTRTRVARVRAEYPNQLDYSGVAIMPDHDIQQLNEAYQLKMRLLQTTSISTEAAFLHAT